MPEELYLKQTIKELIDKCNDTELLRLITSLLDFCIV